MNKLDTNAQARSSSLLARTGYSGAKDTLERKLDTTRPTVGPVERPAPLERARGGSIPGEVGRARGGKMPKHGKTQINVVVPQAPPAAARPAMPPPSPAMHPPMAVPPGGAGGAGAPPIPPPGAGGPPVPGMPPGMPPGPPRPGMKSGGAIGHKMKAGAASGMGRFQKLHAYGTKRGK